MSETIFEGLYATWREKRIALIIKLFGEDYFRGKTLLEVGAGGGQTALYFKSLGAIVTITEGRDENFKLIRQNDPDVECYCMNQDEGWLPLSGRKFDIIIHWGVLYHLNDWQVDLLETTDHLAPEGLLFLESEVLTGADPTAQVRVSEPNHWDQAMSGLAWRMSASFVEAFMENLGFSYDRYDDPDLNIEQNGNVVHNYSWLVDTNFQTPSEEVLSRDKIAQGLRRFWVFRRT